MAFTIKYSIPGRSALKDMQLTTMGHYDELNKKAVKKGSPEVKLEITKDVSRRLPIAFIALNLRRAEKCVYCSCKHEQSGQ
jgi:hypothetical protein